MSIIRIERSLGDRATVVLSGSCALCNGCGGNNAQNDLRQGVEGIDISLTAYQQYRIFWNSLGKPVFSLFLAAVASNLFGLDELESVMAAVIGFMVGYVNCKTLSETILEKNKC